jgi:hypothetical protein
VVVETFIEGEDVGVPDGYSTIPLYENGRIKRISV